MAQFGGPKLVKELHFDGVAKEKLTKGINKIASAVSSTLGASGRTVVIEDDFGNPYVTKDGVTVANSILLNDPVENLGVSMMKQAAQKTEEALAMFRELGDVLWEAIMLSNLGHVAYAQHDYDTAIDSYQNSLHIAREIGDHYGTIRCLRKLGAIAQATGATPQTAQYYEQAFVQAEKIHKPMLFLTRLWHSLLTLDLM